MKHWKIVTKLLKKIIDLGSSAKAKQLITEAATRGVLRKRCSESIQQIYSRTPMPKFSCKFAAYFQSNFY